MEQYDSPLTKYKRTPKLYIDLPSGGNYYPRGALDSTDGKELPVYSMTAKDEISLKTPDALFTSKAMYSVIQNCIPNIKDPRLMPMIDVDFVLAAIRIASYGDTMKIGTKCPKADCGEEAEYQIELQNILDHFNSLTFKSEIKVNDFLLRIRPLSYQEINEVNSKTMTVQRALVQQVPSIQDQEERQNKINQLYDEINSLQSDLVYSIVTEITTPDGDREIHHNFIIDFLANNDPAFFNAARECYQEQNRLWTTPISTVNCSECNTEYKISPGLDQANFFVNV